MPLIGKKGKTASGIFVISIAILAMLYVTNWEPVSVLGKVAACASVLYVAAMMIIGKGK